MKILGIDYGRAKVGIALAISPLAEPLEVIRYKDISILFENIKKIVEKYEIEKVVVGISENEMAYESLRFSNQLKRELNLEVENFDETLSSQEATALAIQSGISQKKRHDMEDAYAATVMLQNYLDDFDI